MSLIYEALLKTIFLSSTSGAYNALHLSNCDTEAIYCDIHIASRTPEFQNCFDFLQSLLSADLVTAALRTKVGSIQFNRVKQGLSDSGVFRLFSDHTPGLEIAGASVLFLCVGKYAICYLARNIDWIKIFLTNSAQIRVKQCRV
jgi:hypothetical protein